jgi:hypothetical protein
MSQICKIGRFLCAFIMAGAIAQLVSLLPWSLLVVGVAATIAYTTGQKENSMILQVIAIGLIFGWAKCYFAG